ncbi:MAG TPA: prohibitin family protein [Thermodesulfobacteriota bacterium]|nr:prohibitin family protein [Thermodesulfobacteriota bacterium]
MQYSSSEDWAKKYQQSMKGMKNIIYGIIAFVVIVIIIRQLPFGTVGAGERGVLLRWDAVTGKIYDEGLFFRIPVMEKVIKMDIKIQKDQVEAAASSKDLQQISSVIALNFHINPDSVAKVYQEVGVNFKERIIDPIVQESMKAVIAKFTAEQLITQRETVRDQIKTLLYEKLKPHGIVIDEFNMVDFNFSKVFNDAIEAKVTAEQQALTAKNKLEQIKFEAEQRIAEAKGKAEALRLESQAIRDNPQVIQLRLLEKWDGHYPQYVGGGMPLPVVNIPSEK